MELGDEQAALLGCSLCTAEWPGPASANAVVALESRNAREDGFCLLPGVRGLLFEIRAD